MSVRDGTGTTAGVRSGQSSWPADAKNAMAYLEDGAMPRVERRHEHRNRYRTLVKFAPANADWSNPATTLYTRDVNPWALGFVTLRAMETGTRGTVLVPMPDGATIKATGVVRRCREFRTGWYEGILQFTQEQTAFEKKSE